MNYRTDSTDRIDMVKSYATMKTAEKAVEKAFGPQDPEAGERTFSVMYVWNSRQRVVPMLCNIREGRAMTIAIQSGFMLVN